MIAYETDDAKAQVYIASGDDFAVTLKGNEAGVARFNRVRLEDLRAIIDAALNTSAEELDS